MKKYSKYLLLSVFILPANISSAQVNIQYGFGVLLEGNKVFMSINIRAGSICTGIEIERSTDSVNFKQIGIIPGICGNSSSDVPYSFTDVEPVANATNYYRLIFRGNQYSDIQKVLFVELNNAGYKILPNPVSNEAAIYFDNADKKSFALTVSNLKGERFMKLESIKDDKVVFSTAGFLSGTYFFELGNEDGRKVTGKFVVQ